MRPALWTPEERPLGTAFFAREAELVARELLGARLVSNLGGVTTAGVIVETEACGGADDPASHAATRVGRTGRNAAMFGPAGRVYIYRAYVVRERGHGSARRSAGRFVAWTGSPDGRA